MANSKTIAWAKLGQLVGFGRQRINYRTATAVSINKRIKIVEDEQRQKRGRAMY